MALLARRKYTNTSFLQSRKTAAPVPSPPERYTGEEVAEMVCQRIREALGRGDGVNLGSPSVRALETAQRLSEALREGVLREEFPSLFRGYLKAHRCPTEDPWTDGTEPLFYVRVTKGGEPLEGYTANAWQAQIIGVYWKTAEPLSEFHAVRL